MREIARLSDRVARRYYEIPKDRRNGKCQITASSSFFVPKPFTPFQWASMCTAEEYMRRARNCKRRFHAQLNRKSLKYNWHDAQVTVLEGVMARGDRKIGKVVEKHTGWDVCLTPGRKVFTTICGCRLLKIPALILPFITCGKEERTSSFRGILSTQA